jgi:hypothetical protein
MEEDVKRHVRFDRYGLGGHPTSSRHLFKCVNAYHVPKSPTYFEDAGQEPMLAPFDWAGYKAARSGHRRGIGPSTVSKLLQALQLSQVLPVLGAARRALHLDQVIQGCEGRGDSSDIGHHAAPPALCKPGSSLDEGVKVERQIILAEQDLVASEVVDVRIRNVVAERGQCAAKAFDVGLVPVHEQVHVGRRSDPPVRRESRCPDNQVSDVRVV